jgi:hypothetical protein
MVNEKPRCNHHQELFIGAGELICNSKIRICETFENSSTLEPTDCNYRFCSFCDPVCDYVDEITGTESYHIPGFFPIPKKLFLISPEPVCHDICVSCYIHVRNRKLHQSQCGLGHVFDELCKPKRVKYVKSFEYEEQLRLMNFGFKANSDPTFLDGKTKYFIHTTGADNGSDEQLKQYELLEDFEDNLITYRMQNSIPYVRWYNKRHRLR